ncbi:MAG: hypothetical protein MJA31_17715 [Clostridia bacterium]|nr:hypothetical protein [Clostridia bacterium]
MKDKKQYREPEVDMTPVSQRDTSDLPIWIQKITPYFFIFFRSIHYKYANL